MNKIILIFDGEDWKKAINLGEDLNPCERGLLVFQQVRKYSVTPYNLATNISSGSHCLESFIHREEGDVSIISVCRAAGWDRFYKLSVVESLMRMTGWLTGKKEIATIQILMTNANITRNRPQSLGRLTCSMSDCI